MRFNPTKWKEMLFDFLPYRLPIQSPLSIGAQAVESVESFKLLGVHFSRNLTWSVHCAGQNHKEGEQTTLYH